MRKTIVRIMAFAALAGGLTGCTGFGGLSENLGESIASQRDPEVVRDGAPSYLILADTLARRSPEDADPQFTAGRLYGTYADSFVEDPERRRILSQTAYDYAHTGLCLRLEEVCAALDGRFPAFRDAVNETVEDEDDAETLYRFAAVWAGWLRARSDDYSALAELPKLEAAFERVIKLAPEIDHGFAHVYQGVLLAQRPAAMGGDPEEARAHFERAIELSDERNLMAKALFAEHYARLVYDRELHDRLVTEVIEADPVADDLTLSNRLAQERARELRSSADSFF
ncbi:MAG: TRAP transporter TatT component family protein [Halofilum sp. (in: g-proteobacteria)]